MHAIRHFIDRSGVPHAHVECAPCLGILDRKSTIFELIVQFFSERGCFPVLTWYGAYRVTLLCNKI